MAEEENIKVVVRIRELIAREKGQEKVSVFYRKDAYHVRLQGGGGRHRHGRQPALLCHGGNSGQKVSRHGELLYIHYVWLDLS